MKKETQAKENMKKKRKKSKLKVVLRIILILILVAVIAYVVNFAIKYNQHLSNNEKVEYDPLSATALGIDPEKMKTIGRLNLLVLGESGVGDGYKLTDSIMVVSYNPQTQQASILSIPRDTYVGKKDRNTATINYLASYKMNAVYRNGTNIPETISCVNNLTGLDIEKYILVDTDAIIEIVDAIGGVYFNVPIDMDYDDPTQDLHIHLKAGEQLIDGEKAEQLLRFRHNNDFSTYPAEYGDNDLGRMRTQREFFQETARQLLKIENATKVLNLMDIVFKNVKTNLDIETAKYYIPYIFKFNTENIQSDVVPGNSELCNQVWIYVANKAKTKQIVEELFTDKVVEEEETNTVNSNTVATNTSTANTEISKQNTSSTNTTTNKATNTATNTTTEKKDTTTSTEKKDEKVTIELLNGTGDKKVLEKAKEQLSKEGYEIKKTGETSSTDKTTIINRTKKSSSVSNDIKSKLGCGVISSGSDNSKVDYTIILGKDYK